MATVSIGCSANWPLFIFPDGCSDARWLLFLRGSLAKMGSPLHFRSRNSLGWVTQKAGGVVTRLTGRSSPSAPLLFVAPLMGPCRPTGAPAQPGLAPTEATNTTFPIHRGRRGGMGQNRPAGAFGPLPT